MCFVFYLRIVPMRRRLRGYSWLPMRISRAVRHRCGLGCRCWLPVQSYFVGRLQRHSRQRSRDLIAKISSAWSQNYEHTSRGWGVTMDLIRLTYLSQTVQNAFATYRCKRKVAVTGQILCSRCGLLNRCYVSGRVCRTDRFARIEM